MPYKIIENSLEDYFLKYRYVFGHSYYDNLNPEIYFQFTSSLAKKVEEEIVKNLINIKEKKKKLYLDYIDNKIETNIKIKNPVEEIENILKKSKIDIPYEDESKLFNSDEKLDLLYNCVLSYQEKNELNVESGDVELFDFIYANKKLLNFIKDIKAKNSTFPTKHKVNTKPDDSFQQVFDPIELLALYKDVFIDLELWPEVKCELKDLIDNVRDTYNENFKKQCELEITRRLYLNGAPNKFFIRELDRNLNLTNASIFRIQENFKKHTGVMIETYGRELSLPRYFDMAIIHFNEIYTIGKNRIQEIKKLSVDDIQKTNIPKIENPSESLLNTNTTIPKRTPDKWYALLYLIENKLYDRNIPINDEGSFIRREIEEIGKERCENSGQGFYRNVIEHIDTVQSYEKIKKNFGKDWEEKIIKLSNNDPKIIGYLKSFKP